MSKNRYAHITSQQLAKICGVSQGTVDRALNDRAGISPQTKAKILDAAKQYGYIPNLPQTTLASGQSMLYGIVLLNLHNDYFSRFIMDFEALCQSVGYHSIVMFSHNDLQTEIGCINQLVHLGVDGIVLCSVGQGTEYASFLQSLPSPVVTVGNRIEGLPFVGPNDARAMQDMTEYAIAKGYRELIYYAPVLRKKGQENIFAQEERYRGFCEALVAQGISSSLITEHDQILPLLSNIKKGAVLCPSDFYAVRLLGLIQANGLEQIGIGGFDNSDMLEKGNLEIDSIAYDRHALVNGIYKALRRENQSEIIYIPHSLVKRGSL